MPYYSSDDRSSLWFILLVVALVMGGLLFVGGCATQGIMSEYSTGTRLGTIVKYSRKGIIWKTWEGEMNMGSVTRTDDGVVATRWQFTVLDKALIPKVEEAMSTGKGVALHYREYLLKPMWVGSRYIITGVGDPPKAVDASSTKEGL